MGRGVWKVSKSYEDLCQEAETRGFQVLLFTSDEVVEPGGKVLQRGEMTTLALKRNGRHSPPFLREFLRDGVDLAEAATRLLQRLPAR